MNGIELIAAERQRQIEAEGWTAAHDDCHRHNELAIAAACYALPPQARDCYIFDDPADFAVPAKKIHLPKIWPFEDCWWKPSDRIRELVKAGAMIAAEIDRLQRCSPTSNHGA